MGEEQETGLDAKQLLKNVVDLFLFRSLKMITWTVTEKGTKTHMER